MKCPFPNAFGPGKPQARPYFDKTNWAVRLSCSPPQLDCPKCQNKDLTPLNYFLLWVKIDISPKTPISLALGILMQSPLYSEYYLVWIKTGRWFKLVIPQRQYMSHLVPKMLKCLPVPDPTRMPNSPGIWAGALHWRLNSWWFKNTNLIHSALMFGTFMSVMQMKVAQRVWIQILQKKGQISWEVVWLMWWLVAWGKESPYYWLQLILPCVIQHQ